VHHYVRTDQNEPYTFKDLGQQRAELYHGLKPLEYQIRTGEWDVGYGRQRGDLYPVPTGYFSNSRTFALHWSAMSSAVGIYDRAENLEGIIVNTPALPTVIA
jgi:hypothetical protein